jgi:hypothetical protein
VRTILMARPESVRASQRFNLRAGAGYNVVTCPGPWPQARCARHTMGYCPMTEGADLMLYDAGLQLVGVAPIDEHHLAVRASLQRPAQPDRCCVTPVAGPE